MSLKVENVMVQNVITVNVDVTVKGAVSIMNENEIGCLIVVKQGKAVGIVTERDMLIRVLAEARDPERTKVSEIMSSPLIVVDPKMDIENAAKLMFKMCVKNFQLFQTASLLA